MSGLWTRRKLIAGGAAAAIAGVGARYASVPPDAVGPNALFGLGETLTYAAQRAMIGPGAMGREFGRGEISKVATVAGRAPKKGEYRRLAAGDFSEWRLRVDGLVERPASYSLGELKAMPGRSQITQVICEMGWSYIAEWHGVMLADVLRAAGTSNRARYVALLPYDTQWESIDMADAWHPQTMLTYGMNGEDLPANHGAPVRLRVGRALGYKSVKYLKQVVVMDEAMLRRTGKGWGGSNPEEGYSWYAGI